MESAAHDRDQAAQGDPAAQRPADLAGLLGAAAEAAPDHVALVEATHTLTWAELDRAVDRLVWGLGRSGLVGGQRVLIAVDNRIEFVVAWFAVLRAQLVGVPVNPASSAADLTRVITDSGARLVLAAPLAAAAVGEAVGRLEEPPDVVYIAEASYAALLEADPVETPALPDPEKLAALLYTSGTSSIPRGAMLTHRAFLANVAQIDAVEQPLVRPDDVVLGVVPLFHVYGLNAVLSSVVRHHATLVLVDEFDPHRVLDIIAEHQVSVVPVAPPVFAHWLGDEGEGVPRLAERLASVRLIVSGSSALPGEVIERFTRITGHAVHQGYGLTEAAPVVTSTLVGEAGVGSLGRVLPGQELRLLDALGAQPEYADEGEVWIRGANLFSGYWPAGTDGPDDEGWWATGDVGFLDESGELTLVDRLPDVIVVSGFSVYPHEVEDVIAELPEVRGVAVVAAPDEHTGQGVIAWVKATTADPVALEAAVIEHCARRMARFKVPRKVDVVDQLPVTPTGRVQRGRVRQQAARQALEILP